MIILIFIGYALLAVYEFVPLYKQKKWVDFWVNAALYVFSFTIAALLSLNIPVPSPAVPISRAVTSLFGK
ncbi:MAG: hypothetical protein N3I35_14620 [Clostridia bacterium]|nr:hypothetical protein [Clostridia bacterium]